MVKKRGASNKGIELDSGVEIQKIDTESRWKLKRYTALKIIMLVVLVIGIGIASFQLFSYYSDKWELQRKDDLVWKAMYELSMVESDKTVNYLRLLDTRYEDGMLKMNFLVHNPGFSPFILKDSVIRTMFNSVLILNREHWATVAHYLEEAEVDAELTFIYRDMAPTMVITHRQLSVAMDDDRLMDTATADFALFKTKEVLGYARQHFRGDQYISPDSTTLDSDYITLYLSFDDSKYRLGESYLDTTRVDLHFTDRVGDMGSILDGMLAICSRTDRGFAFVYKGTKKNTIHRLEWNLERTHQLLADHSKRIWHKDAETNQVHTIATKERRK